MNFNYINEEEEEDQSRETIYFEQIGDDTEVYRKRAGLSQLVRVRAYVAYTST